MSEDLKAFRRRKAEEKPKKTSEETKKEEEIEYNKKMRPLGVWGNEAVALQLLLRSKVPKDPTNHIMSYMFYDENDSQLLMDSRRTKRKAMMHIAAMMCWETTQTNEEDGKKCYISKVTRRFCGKLHRPVRPPPGIIENIRPGQPAVLHSSKFGSDAELANPLVMGMDRGRTAMYMIENIFCSNCGNFWKYEPTRFLSERGERREIKIPVHLLCNCHMKDFHIPKPQEAEIIKIRNKIMKNK